MLAAALEAEVNACIAELADQRDEHGRRLVVRNGYHQPRKVTTAAGVVDVKTPRVNDKRVDETTRERKRFSSAILPPWCRKSPQSSAVLPLLNLHGLSSGDFVPALEQSEVHRAGIGHDSASRPRSAGGYVQRADLVMRAPDSGAPVLLLEIDRRTGDAHDLVHKPRRYWQWGRLLASDADRYTVSLARSRPDAIEHIDHEKRLWRRVYPPTGREGLVLVAFVFADATDTKVSNTVAVLEEAGRRYWAPRRYESYHRGITALDYRQAVPVVVTTLEQFQEHGADAAVWRRLGRTGEQTLTDALDNPDGDALYEFQAARADAEEKQRQAAEREARRPVCARCKAKFTDERWEEISTRSRRWEAGDLTVCGTCHADDVARKQAAAEAARAAAAAQAAEPDPDDGQEPGGLRGLFRRRS